MELSLPLQAGLDLLLQSHQYAVELSRDPWLFAVELAGLRSAGLTNNDLRWLLYKGYVVQAWETTRLGDERRTFDTRAKLLLGEQSCFILTPAGVEAARALPASTPRHPSFAPPAPAAGPLAPAETFGPLWDKDRRALLFGPHLIKHFKVPAPNQEIVLAAFQEEHWPRRIDDPLPGHAAIDPKRRLHDTINSLNRNQRLSLLRFLGDGSGQAVCWESVHRPSFGNDPKGDGPIDADASDEPTSCG